MASLAVKYRPKTWADVTEQSVVVEMLKNICEKDELQCRNFLLTGPAGCAKAQPLDSRVLTPSGFVTMKDIHVGDEVVTASNNIGQVASIHPQGKRNIYEMRCQDGATIQVADNHLNVVDIFNYRTGWSVENCVISTDKLLSYFNSHRYRISVKATHVDFNERSVPLDPYLVGVIAACGYATDCIHLNLKYASESTMKRISGIVARYNAILRPVSDENEGHYFIRCNNATYRYTWNDEPASIKSIISNIKAMTGRKISSSTVCKVASGGHAAMCDEFPQALSLIGKADNNIFYKLSQLGMRETRHDMKLDESYIYNTSDIRTQVIEGMIACCGEETVSGTRMKLMSPTLAAQVVDIIRSLGFVSTIKTVSRYDIRLKHNIISYWVNVRLHDTNGDMLQTRPIVSMKSVGYHDCQCIYIDHDDHTYISDGFIPTHNTTLARIMANALNKDICEPIEIDAASNNGVDSVREIVKQASQYPIGSKYKVFIHDECHAYSQASWSILLKTIEEQPAKTVMIFCTTNPEKIPPTIISRVQVFQLSKISTQGIQNRLKYILDCENNEGKDIKYDINSLGLIAKMANGGMRDAITLMEKSLSYSTTIDDMTLTSALGLPPYDDYFEFLKGYAKHDNAAISASINKAYNSGINFIRWIQDLHAFVMNVVKYIYMQDMSYTTIPSFYQPKLANYNTAHVIVCLRLANKLINLLNELKTTSYQQEVALTYLCAVPKKV